MEERMTNGGSCVICKIVKLLAGIGALNWGLVAFLNLNLVEKLLGAGTLLSQIVYGLVALSGLAAIVSVFACCKCCGKGKDCAKP
jgi:uncharacterized membrane protein YuzA (DUF378 family)